MRRWTPFLVGLALGLMIILAMWSLLSGCVYESEATGWSPDAGPDVHRGEYLTPPAARLEHSKGKTP